MENIKDIFGKPREGIHSYRIHNIAVVDVVLTIVFGIFFGYMVRNIITLSNNQTINLIFSSILMTIILFFIGCLLHYFLNVDTTVNLFIKELISKYT